MPRPSSTPDWATDTDYPAGTDAWSATPIRVEPDSGQKAAGFTPARRPPAQWFNWLFGLVGDWITWLDSLWASETLTKSLHLIPSLGTQDVAFTVPEWLSAIGSNNPNLLSNRDSARCHIAIPLLKDEVLLGVDVSVNPGQARSGGARMTFTIRQAQIVWGTGTGVVAFSDLASATDDGTTNQQRVPVDVTSPPGGWSVSDGDTFYLEIQAGDNAGTVIDAVYAARVRYKSRNRQT